MVASYQAGDLVRSLVRIPGSGMDKTLESSCIDLGNVSSLAASVMVPRTLPAALKRPLVKNRESENENEKRNDLAKKVVDGENVKLSLELGTVQSNGQEELKVSPPPAKKPRVLYMTQEQATNTFPSGRVLQTASGPVFIVSANQMQSQPQQPEPVKFSAPSVSELIQQREALREENRTLQHQLALFQQLFKDKKRLASVVQRLGVQIPAA